MAHLNNSLTFLAPIPTYFYTNSLPLTEKNDIPASFAHAFANIVLPVPGGPVKSAPLGILAPKFLNFDGFFKKSTNSLISNLASFKPAISLKLTFRSYDRKFYILKFFFYPPKSIFRDYLFLNKI